jgi:hypothetical protein
VRKPWREGPITIGSLAPSKTYQQERGAMDTRIELNGRDSDTLRCPHCGADNLHHGKVMVFGRRKLGQEREDGNSYAVVVDGRHVMRAIGPDIEQANPSSRRNGVAISIYVRAMPRSAAADNCTAQRRHLC